MRYVISALFVATAIITIALIVVFNDPSMSMRPQPASVARVDHFTQVNGGFYPGQEMGAGWLSATPIFPLCDNKPLRKKDNPKQCSAFKESGLTGILLFINWRVDDPFAVYEPNKKANPVDILIHFRQQYPQYEVE